MAEAKAITSYVVEYLKEHAQARSSLESIATWRMTRQQLSEPTDTARAAPEQLRSTVVITDRVTPVGRTVYLLGDRRVAPLVEQFACELVPKLVMPFAFFGRL